MASWYRFPSDVLKRAAVEFLTFSDVCKLMATNRETRCILTDLVRTANVVVLDGDNRSVQSTKMVPLDNYITAPGDLLEVKLTTEEEMLFALFKCLVDLDDVDSSLFYVHHVSYYHIPRPIIAVIQGRLIRGHELMSILESWMRKLVHVAQPIWTAELSKPRGSGSLSLTLLQMAASGCLGRDGALIIFSLAPASDNCCTVADLLSKSSSTTIDQEFPWPYCYSSSPVELIPAHELWSRINRVYVMRKSREFIDSQAPALWFPFVLHWLRRNQDVRRLAIFNVGNPDTQNRKVRGWKKFSVTWRPSPRRPVPNHLQIMQLATLQRSFTTMLGPSTLDSMELNRMTDCLINLRRIHSFPTTTTSARSTEQIPWYDVSFDLVNTPSSVLNHFFESQGEARLVSSSANYDKSLEARLRAVASLTHDKQQAYAKWILGCYQRRLHRSKWSEQTVTKDAAGGSTTSGGWHTKKKRKVATSGDISSSCSALYKLVQDESCHFAREVRALLRNMLETKSEVRQLVASFVADNIVKWKQKRVNFNLDAATERARFTRFFEILYEPLTVNSMDIAARHRAKAHVLAELAAEVNQGLCYAPKFSNRPMFVLAFQLPAHALFKEWSNLPPTMCTWEAIHSESRL